MMENKWLIVLMFSYLAYLIVYFFIDVIYYKIKKIDYNGLDTKIIAVKIKLLFVSFLEWSCAFFLFALIIKQFDTGLNYFTILGIYSVASVAGIVSMLPGSAGSFDLLILLGFKLYGVSTEHALAALILYRTFYYFSHLPLVLYSRYYFN